MGAKKSSYEASFSNKMKICDFSIFAMPWKAILFWTCPNKIKNESSEKLLGIAIDSKLSFNEHLDKICEKASQKLNVLSTVPSFMSMEKIRVSYENNY